jgi:Flp pilus assembly CpaE family ATPase
LVWTIEIIFYVIAGARDKFPVDFRFNLWFDSSQLLKESDELMRVKDQAMVSCRQQ